MFAFENWHSALEMKRYITRFIHHVGGLPDFSALRFTRYNLSYYTTGGEMEGEGNSESIEYGDQSFRMNNTTLESTTQWGSGIQHPLTLIPLGSEIKLVVKSQYGWTAEIAYVQPFLYHLRYYPGKI